jgi:hypothetical protein
MIECKKHRRIAPEKPCNAFVVYEPRIMNILADFSSIRGLSVAGPFCWELAAGKKAIELRSWKTSHRGTILLHASSGNSYEHLFHHFGMSRENCPKFAIIGAARLVDCICYDRPEKWEADLDRHCWVGTESYEEVVALYGKYPYGHVLEDAIAFPEPILNVTGAFNYWQAKNDCQRLGFEKAIALLKSLGYLN